VNAIDEILLLTSPAAGEAITRFLRGIRPGLRVTTVPTLRALEEQGDRFGPGTRLVAFTTGIIVPARILAALGGPAYNIHPGPPAHPGTFPDVHALMQGDTTFGATLHVMHPRVDEGPIVDVKAFDILADADRVWLATRAMRAAGDLMLAWGARLVGSAEPLPTRSDLAWGARKWRMADMTALCAVDATMPQVEVERRARAVLGGTMGTLRLDWNGRRFRLEPDGPDPDLTPFS
jgi:methionyl-tRNA formyltransferase